MGLTDTELDRRPGINWNCLSERVAAECCAELVLGRDRHSGYLEAARRDLRIR